MNFNFNIYSYVTDSYILATCELYTAIHSHTAWGYVTNSICEKLKYSYKCILWLLAYKVSFRKQEEPGRG